MTEEELLAEVNRLRGEVAGLRSAVAHLAEHLLGGQITDLLTMFATGDEPASHPEMPSAFATDGSFSDWPGRPRPDLVPQLPYTPPRPPEDSLPRSGRNPRIFCEQYESGTWIHGRPHNCPTWARR